MDDRAVCVCENVAQILIHESLPAEVTGETDAINKWGECLDRTREIESQERERRCGLV